jgi:hypothetical protein
VDVDGRIRRTKHAARTRQMRNAYRDLVGISEGKKPLARLKYIWEDNIKIN